MWDGFVWKFRGKPWKTSTFDCWSLFFPWTIVIVTMGINGVFFSYLETHPQNGLLDHVLLMDREHGDYLRLLMHRAQTTCKTGGLSSNPALCHCKCNFIETMLTISHKIPHTIPHISQNISQWYFSVFFLTLNVEVWFRSPLEDCVAIHRSKHTAGHLEPPWNQMIQSVFQRVSQALSICARKSTGMNGHCQANAAFENNSDALFSPDGCNQLTACYLF